VQKHQRRFSAMTQDLLRLAHWLRRKREHPTGTERKSLDYECGWKGDRGGLAERKNEKISGRECEQILGTDRRSPRKELSLVSPDRPTWQQDAPARYQFRLPMPSCKFRRSQSKVKT
jgi:hypothetical protein